MTASVPGHFPRTRQVIERGLERKHHHGVQVYVSREFAPALNLAMGTNAPGQPLTDGILMLWMSSGKPLTAFAVMQFVEADRLDLDQPVADIIPEFAQGGKEQVTLKHLLTHTAGLKPIASGWPHRSWDDIIARICASSLQPDWIPGKSAAYDPARSWFILGEILKRVDGRPIDRLLREDVLEPIGMMNSWLAIPPHLYDAYGDRIGVTYTLKDGALTQTQAHERETVEHPSPGGGMRGPIQELGLFYEMLLRGGETASGQQLMQPETVHLMTQRHREGMHDATFHHKVDFGLGLIINSNRYGPQTVPYGFGRSAGDDAFGHGGAQSSIGFADPTNQVVVTAAANGCPGEVLHNQRFRELCSAIYEDLGLAG